MDADFGYAGYYVHAASGLDLTLYRAYDPVSARWLSRDPLKDAERSEGPNLQEYCRNNSLRFKDPEGKFALPVVLGLAVVAGLVEAYDEAKACEELSPGEDVYIRTPMSRIAPFSGVADAIAMTANPNSGGNVFFMHVMKNKCGKCTSELVAFPLLGKGA